MTNRHYICSCGTFELNQSIKDGVLTKCPNCGGSCRIHHQAQQNNTLPAYVDIKVNKKTGIRKDYRERTSPYFNGINKE